MPKRVVRKGEDWGAIAKMYGVSPEQLRHWNQSIYSLSPGVVLNINDLSKSQPGIAVNTAQGYFDPSKNYQTPFWNAGQYSPSWVNPNKANWVDRNRGMDTQNRRTPTPNNVFVDRNGGMDTAKMNSYVPNTLTGGRGNFNASSYNAMRANYTGFAPLTRGQQADAARLNGLAAEWALSQSVPQQPQNTLGGNIGKWSRGEMRGRDMKALYGRNWKERFRIKGGGNKRSGAGRSDNTGFFGSTGEFIWRI